MTLTITVPDEDVQASTPGPRREASRPSNMLWKFSSTIWLASRPVRRQSGSIIFPTSS